MTNGVPFASIRNESRVTLKPFHMLTVAENQARLRDRHQRSMLAYARRMGKRLATITKHGDALIDVVLAKTLLRQYGVEEQFFADAIVAGRAARARVSAVLS